MGWFPPTYNQGVTTHFNRKDVAMVPSLFQVHVLYDFEAQPDTGELTITAGEVLTLTRCPSLKPFLFVSVAPLKDTLFVHCSSKRLGQGILKGKYHCTVDLLFDWFGLVCYVNKNKNCQLS
jgi:hypothetical protein